MARSRRLEVVIAGDAKGALASMSAVERRASGLGGSFKMVGAAAVAGFAVVGAAAVGAGAALYSIGSSFDSAYDKIRVNTGATGEALGSLQESFRNVVRNVPTDFGTASEAIAGLNQRLGLTGEPLERVSTRMLELSRLTETDLSANVANLSRVFGDWGIEAGQMPDTMDQLFRATQQSGVGMEQLSSQVVQFGAPLRNLGFSFSDSVAMLAQFEAQGVNTSTVMSGMRQGLKNFAADGEVPADAFRRFSEGVQNGTLDMTDAMETFGARAGPDMFAAISEGRFDFEALSSSIAGGSDTIMAASRDTRDFGEQWQIIKNRVMLALEPVATRVFAAVGDAMTKLGSVVDRLSAWFTENLPPAMRKIQEVVDDVWPRVLEAFHTVETWVRAHWPEISRVITDTMDSIVQGVTGFVDVVMTLWNNFGDNIIDTVRRNFGPVLQIVRGVMTTIRGVISTITALIHGDWSGVWKGVKQTFAGVWSTILGATQVVFNNLRMVVGMALEVLGSVVKGALRPIGAFFTSVWSGISSAVGAAWRFIVGVTRTQISVVRTVIGGALSAIRGAWSTVWGAIRGVATTVWRNIRTAVSGGMDFIRRSVRGGVDAIRDIWSGLKRAFEVPVNWVIRNVINKFLGVMRTVADVVNLGGIIPGNVALIGSGATSFHTGGVVGETGGRPHSGTLRPGEVPAVLQAGETVVDRLGRVAGRPAADVIAERYGVGSDNGLRALGLPIGGFPNPVSAIAGVAQDAVDFVSDRLRDLAAGGLSRLLGPVRGAITDATGRFGMPGEVFGGMVNRPIDALIQWVAGATNEADKRAAPTFGAGHIWQQMYNAVAAAVPGTHLSSGYRNTMTATGRVSRHALGRAVDLTGNMDRIFEWIHGAYPNAYELIYSPKGGRQLYHGAPHFYGEPTRGDHWDHVHWSMANGGLVKGGRGGVMAHIGEGRHDELVTPLPAGGLGGLGGGLTLEVNVDVRGSVLTQGDLLQAIDQALRKGFTAPELERLIRRMSN